MLVPRQEAGNDLDWQQNRRYGIVIDAGSSGSRVHIYSWKDYAHLVETQPPEALRGKIPTVERGDKLGLKWTLKEHPGISSYAGKTKDIGEHLKMLLDFAEEVVPVQEHNRTPIFVMATAGMRLLPKEDQDDILRSTCNYIKKNSNFKLDNCGKQIKIISGELEGLYGWTAVNYLMGGFDASIGAALDEQPKNAGGIREQHHTFGFLDMGGASTQIAFEPEHHQKEEHMDDLEKITLHTLDGRRIEYDVFVTTFLGYGSNEARRRYLEDRVRMAYQEAGPKADLLDEHHTLHLDDPCLPTNLNLTDSSSTSIALTLHGTGSFSKCLESTLPLLNKDVECPTEPCLFNGVHTPHIDWLVNKFVGISEYWYSSHDILGLGGVYDFLEYEKKATDYCQSEWETILSEHKHASDLDMQRFEMQCFKAAWIVNVLHDGIEIPRIVDDGGQGTAAKEKEVLEQSIESVNAKHWSPPFQSIDTINDIQVSWTLGAMLQYVSDQIPVTDSGVPGHSTDDEGPHLSDKEHGQPPLENVIGVPGNTISKSLAGSTHSLGFFVMFIMVLCCILVWCISRSRSHRRAAKSPYDPTAGILGNSDAMHSSQFHGGRSQLSQIHPARLFRESLGTARYWISRVWRSNRSYNQASMSMQELEADDADYRVSVSELDNIGSDGVTINIGASPSIAGLRRPTSATSVRSQPSAPTRPWGKKRYSGDSVALGLLGPQSAVSSPGGAEYTGIKSSSSALGLSNRNGSFTNLTARTGSAPNLNSFYQHSLHSTPPPVSTDDNTGYLAAVVSTVSPRKPTRMGYSVTETSEEEDNDYVSHNSPTTSTVVDIPTSNNNGRASPTASQDDTRWRRGDISS
ncbi:Golgi apyrase [Umbelopsis nana]